jgi:hypothetical protein
MIKLSCQVLVDEPLLDRPKDSGSCEVQVLYAGLLLEEIAYSVLTADPQALHHGVAQKHDSLSLVRFGPRPIPCPERVRLVKHVVASSAHS